MNIQQVNYVHEAQERPQLMWHMKSSSKITHTSLRNAWQPFRHEMQTCALGIGTPKAIHGAEIHWPFMTGFAAEIKVCLESFTDDLVFIWPWIHDLSISDNPRNQSHWRFANMSKYLYWVLHRTLTVPHTCEATIGDNNCNRNLDDLVSI